MTNDSNSRARRRLIALFSGGVVLGLIWERRVVSVPSARGRLSEIVGIYGVQRSCFGASTGAAEWRALAIVITVVASIGSSTSGDESVSAFLDGNVRAGTSVAGRHPSGAEATTGRDTLVHEGSERRPLW